MIRFSVLLLMAAVSASTQPPLVAFAEPVRVRFVEAEIVSEVDAIKAGEPFWVGLRLAMDPHWHTYWRNPGDSGLPTTLGWDLPEGFSAGKIQWPYPQRFERAAYVSYGYEDEVLLIVEITPPAVLPAGEAVGLTARADWTVCREDMCLPGGADLMLELAVTEDAAKPDRYWAAWFDKTRRRLPRNVPDWNAEATIAKGTIALTLTSPAAHDPGSITVMERDQGLLDHKKPVLVQRDSGAIMLSLPLAGEAPPEELNLVLVSSGSWDGEGHIKALELSVPLAAR